MRQYCFRLGLYYQGLTHDLSKYSPSEFWRGVKYYQGYRSPNDAERRENGVSLAWLHHKGRNRHHFEYWIDYCIGDNGKVYMGGCKMPLRYVAEMFCDRIPRPASASARCCSYSRSRARTRRSTMCALFCARKSNVRQNEKTVRRSLAILHISE